MTQIRAAMEPGEAKTLHSEEKRHCCIVKDFVLFLEIIMASSSDGTILGTRYLCESAVCKTRAKSPKISASFVVKGNLIEVSVRLK